MSFIEEELEESEKIIKFEFLNSKKKLVALTRKNVALAEAIIKHDYSYNRSMDKNAGPKGAYQGSSAYWISQVKAYWNEGKKKDSEYKKIIEEVVNAVDRENSTHLNADRDGKKVGRKEIVQRILGYEINDLEECLKHIHIGGFDFLNFLAKETSVKKHNLSFASKFCSLLCFWIFEGKKEQDNFVKYDSVIKAVLPYYAKQYKIELKKSELEKNYKKYYETIDEIIKKSGNKISRNGFDQLLWYFYKGKNIKEFMK